MKNIYILLLICLFLMPNSIYPKNSDQIEIRGFQFGDTKSCILNKESIKKEFQLMISRTNTSQLVYKGTLLNKPVSLIYFFKQNRLARLSYIWEQKNDDPIFEHRIKQLLHSKYNDPITNIITASNSSIEISSYIKVLTNKKLLSPILYISLEKINMKNTNYTTVLEFKAYDSDMVINTKILKEDI